MVMILFEVTDRGCDCLMYGESLLNSANLLRYAWTKEFFERFQNLKYHNMEIPLTLIGAFHGFIRPFVNNKMASASYVEFLQKKHSLYTMQQVQSALLRKESMIRDLEKVPYRSTILLSSGLFTFALDKLREHNVIILILNLREREKIKKESLPNNFRIFDYLEETRKVKLSSEILNRTRKQIANLIKANRNHPVFGSNTFGHWLYVRSVHSMRTIEALEYLIRKKSIGIIMGQTEIANPGTTLSLLANRYNLPFILTPQVLFTDISLIPTRASYHMVWGKNYKDWLEERGIDPKRLIITGNLKFSYAKPNKYCDKKEFLNKYGIPPNHLLVTYTSQHYNEIVIHNILKWICVAVQESLGIIFLIKPHPIDKYDYSNYINNPHITLLPQKAELHEILFHSDLVMTVSSNTAIEAASMDKGILVLQPPLPYDYTQNHNDFPAHLVNASAGLVAYSGADLVQHLKKFSRSWAHRMCLTIQAKRFINDTLQTSQNPAELVAMFIKKLLKDKL